MARFQGSEYYTLTQFEDRKETKWSYTDIKSAESRLGKSEINKFQVSREVFKRILQYIEDDLIRTRHPAPESITSEGPSSSFSVSTIKFSMHAIKGSRGGWYIISNGGELPIIKNEFIEYGPKRKSGRRRYSARRNLSQTELSQIEWLQERTPSIETIHEWVSKKYPDHIYKVDVSFRDDTSDLFKPFATTKRRADKK